MVISVCVCECVRKEDILINTIWLSRHEAYLSHVHPQNLLRKRDREGRKDKMKRAINRWWEGLSK